MNANQFTAWAAIESEAARLKQMTLLELFAAEPTRVQALSCAAPHLLADFSKQRLDAGAVAALEELAAAMDFAGWRAKLFAGGAVNNT